MEDNFEETLNKGEAAKAFHAVLSTVEELKDVIKIHQDIITNLNERILHLEEMKDAMLNEVGEHMKMMSQLTNMFESLSERVNLIQKNLL